MASKDRDDDDDRKTGDIFIDATTATTGSVVRLRSGGMLLTVVSVLANDNLVAVGVGPIGPEVELVGARTVFQQRVSQFK